MPTVELSKASHWRGSDYGHKRLCGKLGYSCHPEARDFCGPKDLCSPPRTTQVLHFVQDDNLPARDETEANYVPVSESLPGSSGYSSQSAGAARIADAGHIPALPAQSARRAIASRVILLRHRDSP